MNIFSYMQQYDYEKLLYCCDIGVGLTAIICIHDTTLGPALGGVRMWKYAKEEEAVLDALHLARAMTYKAAAAGLDLGGGKAVLIGDPLKDKNEALFKALGNSINSLGGRYIATEDVGTTTQDIECVRTHTPFVTGLPEYMGGSGDPSPATAFGIMKAMEACAKEVYGKPALKDKLVAILGVGKVGSNLARLLHKAGARLLVADINKAAIKQVVRQTGAVSSDPDKSIGAECDIFAPCALGAILNTRNIASLRCKIVCGAANNQLLERTNGEEIHKKGILYCPDYIANAGGIINLSLELTGRYNADVASSKLEKVFETTERIIARAKREKISTSRAADLLAEERINRSRKVKHLFSEPHFR